MTSDIAVVDGQAVARRPAGNLAVRVDQDGWTPHQRAALAQLGIDDAPDGDLSVFLHRCQTTGLDPFANQICMIGRNDRDSGRKKWTIQTQIDGFRAIGQDQAKKNGEKIAMPGPLWCGPDLKWREAWLEDEPPAAAKYTILVDGREFTAVARYRSFVQTRRDGKPTRFWQAMDDNQLAKCAEAAAWRKAYPQQLSGMYTDDEMGHNDNVTVVDGRTGEVHPPQRSRPAQTPPPPTETEKADWLDRWQGDFVKAHDADALRQLWGRVERGVTDSYIVRNTERDLKELLTARAAEFTPAEPAPEQPSADAPPAEEPTP